MFMTGGDTRAPAHVWTVASPGEGSPIDTPLPQATAGGRSGLLEILEAHGGREDLPDLASELTFEVDDLLPIVDATQLLGLAMVDDADLEITPDGKIFVAADILESKEIFARRARERAPLVRAICRGLEATKTARSARRSSSISCGAASPRTRPVSNSASRSTGAVTASCSTSTRTPGTHLGPIGRGGRRLRAMAARHHRRSGRRPVSAIIDLWRRSAWALSSVG